MNRHPASRSLLLAGLIAAAAAPNIVPLSFELGGKSPLLVLADADLDLAVRLAVEQFDNAGQVCLGAFRMLVAESLADEFPAWAAALLLAALGLGLIRPWDPGPSAKKRIRARPWCGGCWLTSR